MLSTLPIELTLQIMQHIPLSQLLPLRVVSSSWHEMIDKWLAHRFIYCIDSERLANGRNNFTESITKLTSEKDFTIDRVRISKFDLLQEDFQMHAPMQSIADDVRHLEICDCELSFNFLCFIVNLVKDLNVLRLQVLFDKSMQFRIFHLKSKVFHSLTELNISNSIGMEDQSFSRLSKEMHNLRIFKCVDSKMVFYPYYIRRYYGLGDLRHSWSNPTKFGFTFNMVRAMLTFTDSSLKQIHLGPNISIDNVSQLIKFHLTDVYLMFASKSELDSFETKARSLLGECKIKFYFKEINPV